MNFVKTTDKFIDHLSKIKHIRLVTFFVALLEATISPLLPEAFVLVVLTYRKDISWKVISCVSAAGSAVGASLMYLLGYFFFEKFGQSLLAFIHGESFVEKAKELFSDNSFLALFTSSLTPLPDRVFSLLAGVFMVSPFILFSATFLGRLLRVGVVAFFAQKYGVEARHYIIKHTKLATYLCVIFVVVYIAYRYIQ